VTSGTGNEVVALGDDFDMLEHVRGKDTVDDDLSELAVLDVREARQDLGFRLPHEQERSASPSSTFVRDGDQEEEDTPSLLHCRYLAQWWFSKIDLSL
jgi:hypothetical protein